MSAGDQRIVDKRTTCILKSGEDHRNMGLDTIANYIVFKTGNQYDALI